MTSKKPQDGAPSTTWYAPEHAFRQAAYAVNPLQMAEIELQLCEAKWRANERSALPGAIDICAAMGLPLPPWAAEAFGRVMAEVREGTLPGWDEAFGHDALPATEKRRAGIRRRRKQQAAIVSWLTTNSVNSINDALWERIAVDLKARGTHIGKDQVRALFYQLPAEYRPRKFTEDPEICK